MNKIKIALVGYRLNKGGAERVGAILSTFFDKHGLDVHNIIVLDDIGYPYAGRLKNLGKLKNKTNGPLNKLIRLIELRKYLKHNDFEFIIDFRFRIKPIQEFLISRYVYNTKTIFTVHSAKLNSYMPDQTFLTQLIYANCFKIVSITKEMQRMIEKKHRLKNVTTIYNPVNIEEITQRASEPISLNFDFIIGVGQYDTNVKQFDKLIYAYSQSILPKKNIHLVLLGEGSLKPKLIQVAKENGIENKLHLLGYKKNPYKYIRQALFYVLSSAHEGMPMVLLESLVCGTPIVSFDCKTGPSEIIEDRKNGLLVEDQNIDKLIENMNLFLMDKKLYQYCKSNTIQSAQMYSVDAIGKQWLDLMEFN